MKDSVLKKSDYILQLDGLRCLAIILVFLNHWGPWRFFDIIPFGFLGVTLFFVLSGFLITRILLNGRTDDSGGYRASLKTLKSFYIRRFLRIFPIYYLTIIITTVLFGFELLKDNLPYLYSYTINIYWTFHPNTQGGLVDHFWSLAVEEQFYLIWPLLILFIPRKALSKTLLAVTTIAIVTRSILYINHFDDFPIFIFTLSCFDALGLGALLAYLHIYNPKALERLLSKKIAFLWLVGLFIFIIVYNGYIKPNSLRFFNILFLRLLYSIICFFIVGKAIKGFRGFVKKVLEQRFIVYLGKISYGMYLFHYGLKELLSSDIVINSRLINLRIGSLFQGNPYLFLFAGFLILVLVATLSWYLFEKPINNLKHRFKYNENSLIK
jgi:peptidoglycan/LPS O-acetylase OafA/YrhL